jgi:glycosyltransferase involved in cell wall biosynthesis
MPSKRVSLPLAFSEEEARARGMKVILDISLLGARYDDYKAGVGRAVENLALRLAQHPGCEVRFTAYRSRSVTSKTQRYLRHHPSLEGKLLIGRETIQGLYHTLETRLMAMNASASRDIAFRAFRKVVHWSVRSLAQVEPLQREDLKSTDIFHSPCYQLPEVTRQVPGLKRFLTVYDLIPIHYPQYCGRNAPAQMRAMLESLGPTDEIICHSVATKTDLMAYRKDIPAERISVIPLAAEAVFKPTSAEAVRAVRQRYGLPDGSYVLSVHRVQPRKNIDLVVRAYKRLVEQHDPKGLSLVLCGSSHTARAKLDQAMAKNIIPLGHVPDEDLAPLYSGALVFVYPSLYEGFGLPPLEAMQCGTPVIVSNTTSLPEVVGDAGILMDPADEDGLCQALMGLYRNEALRRDMSRKSLAQAGQFHWDRTVEETVAAYEKGMRS